MRKAAFQDELQARKKSRAHT